MHAESEFDVSFKFGRGGGTGRHAACWRGKIIADLMNVIGPDRRGTRVCMFLTPYRFIACNIDTYEGSGIHWDGFGAYSSNIYPSYSDIHKVYDLHGGSTWGVELGGQKRLSAQVSNPSNPRRTITTLFP